MGSNPSTFKKSGDLAPVETVSWNEAMLFCKKLTEKERKAGRLPKGYIYTLPTEAQWEYACRAGTSTAFSFGDQILKSQANTSIYPSLGRTVSVGTYPSNPWGFHDMHGNVWEWCLDWYGNYLSGRVIDPFCSVPSHARVIRGGSWNHVPSYCRSSYRWFSPSIANNDLGFRVCLSTNR